MEILSKPDLASQFAYERHTLKKNDDDAYRNFIKKLEQSGLTEDDLAEPTAKIWEAEAQSAESRLKEQPLTQDFQREAKRLRGLATMWQEQVNELKGKNPPLAPITSEVK